MARKQLRRMRCNRSSSTFDPLYQVCSSDSAFNVASPSKMYAVCVGPKSSLFDRAATSADLDAAESRLYELGDPTGDAARIEDLQTQLTALQVRVSRACAIQGLSGCACVGIMFPSSSSDVTLLCLF